MTIAPSVHPRFAARFLVAMGLLAATALTGCHRVAGPDYIPTGDVVVMVVDGSNAPVSGATVQVLDATSSFLWAQGTSGSDGAVVFVDSPTPGRRGLLAGSYRAKLTPPSSFVVASSQLNPVPFTVQDKRTTTVTMHVARTP